MFVIERELPNAGKLTPEELKNIAETSCYAIDQIGASIEWIHSYVTADKIYCIYKAENEEVIRVHGFKGKFPVSSISEVAAVISPATAADRVLHQLCLKN